MNHTTLAEAGRDAGASDTAASHSPPDLRRAGRRWRYGSRLRRGGAVAGLIVAGLLAGAGVGEVAAEPGDPTSWYVIGAPPGGGTLSRPSAASWDGVRIDAFVVRHDGTTGTLQQVFDLNNGIPRLWPPVWSGWIDLGAPAIPGGLAANAGPSVVAWDVGRLDVFAMGADGQLWHRWWDGQAWRGWEPLGGVLTATPVVVSRAPGTLDVFVRGTDGQMWHKWWDGGAWLGWEPLGGQLVGAPSGIAGTGEIEVAVRGTDDALWLRYYSPATGWSAWTSAGGVLTGEPADDYLQVVVPGVGGSLWAFVGGEGFHQVGPLPAIDSAPSTVTALNCFSGGCEDYTVFTEIFAIQSNQLVWASDPF